MKFDGFDRDHEFESALVKNNPHSCLKSFNLAEGTLSMTIAPVNNQSDERRVTFEDVRLQNFDLFDFEQSHNLPWDIMGLNCKGHQDGLSFFCIHCLECEMVFLSRWPRVHKPTKH